MRKKIDVPERSYKSFEYGFRCTNDGAGEVCDDENKLLWKFRSEKRTGLCVLLKKPPRFSFCDTEEHEILSITCERRYPFSVFLMVKDGLPLCTIKQCSVLQNKYSINMNDGELWTFYLPLFSVNYIVTSAGGEVGRVRLIRHDTWHAQFSTDVRHPFLMAALALIHRERQRA
jgi:hypothetical protein